MKKANIRSSQKFLDIGEENVKPCSENELIKVFELQECSFKLKHIELAFHVFQTFLLLIIKFYLNCYTY